MAHLPASIVVLRKRKSSGLDLLLSELDTLSSSARQELANLIGPGAAAAAARRDCAVAKKKKKKKLSTNKSSNNSNSSKASVLQNDNDDCVGTRKARQEKQVVVTTPMKEDEILDLVAQSKASLLGSICFLFVGVEERQASTAAATSTAVAATASAKSSSGAGREGDGAVVLSALQIVKFCGLLVDPAHSPGRMDARDVVLAALYFLCETSYLKRAIHGASGKSTKPATGLTSSDLLQQCYEKAYEWNWEEVKDKIMGDLEEAFYQDDPSHYDFLTRKRFLPAFDSLSGPTSDGHRFRLLLRGFVPPP